MRKIVFGVILEDSQQSLMISRVTLVFQQSGNQTGYRLIS